MEENAHLKHEMPTSTPGKTDKYQFSFLITSSLSSPLLKVILDSLHKKCIKQLVRNSVLYNLASFSLLPV